LARDGLPYLARLQYLLSMHPLSLLCIPLLLWASSVTGQSRPVQTLKGQVIERSIRTPLKGATVEIASLGVRAATDASGHFRFEKVPVGIHSLKVTYVGYRSVNLENMALESGKEMVLTIEMEEAVVSETEVVVRNRANKARPLNESALVSARMFSIEETRRFAAGLNDPSRIATAFAGVQPSGDGNALIIRGNAPNGLLWRLEGVDIPNPNHFARVGTSGGAISILSAQLLGNSDFMTGAFPAEYGNALSGVFDIRLRKGNRDKREHTFSASTIGIDFATEGYFKKGYGGSYLFNYRYGFLTLMQKVGFNIGDAATSFQDLSFHLHFPMGKAGDISVFGFGGNSEQDQDVSRDAEEWAQGTARRSGWLDEARTRSAGISHTVNLGRKTLLKSVFNLSGYVYRDEDKRLDRFDGPLIITRDNRFEDHSRTLSVTLTHRFNGKHLLKGGIYQTGKDFELRQREWVSNALRDRVKSSGNTGILNGFLQWRGNLTERLSLVGGIHGMRFALNGTGSVEPRFGLRWMADATRSLSLGFGRHSQIQPLGNYFARIRVGNDTIEPNRGLEPSRADHLVLGYGHRISKDWNFKSELYLQRLSHIPISAAGPTSFSLINQDDDYVIEALANKGRGRNMGMEFTLERYRNDDFYLLTTMSLYGSRYLPSDGEWRSTRFDSNFGMTFLAGKEWQLKRKRPVTFTCDLKSFFGGGVRVTPIDLPRSIALKRTVLDNTRINGDKLAPIARVDLQLEWRVQYGSRTGSFILGVQNLFNRKNPVRQYYDPASQSIKYSYLLGRLPVAGYRVDL
jgi:hypothetical protein